MRHMKYNIVTLLLHLVFHALLFSVCALVAWFILRQIGVDASFAQTAWGLVLVLLGSYYVDTAKQIDESTNDHITGEGATQ